MSTAALQLLQQISSFIYFRLRIISEFYPIGRVIQKVINVFPLHITATSAFTAKRTSKNAAKQNIIYTLRLYIIIEIMVANTLPQATSLQRNSYMYRGVGKPFLLGGTV